MVWVPEVYIIIRQILTMINLSKRHGEIYLQEWSENVDING